MGARRLRLHATLRRATRPSPPLWRGPRATQRTHQMPLRLAEAHQPKIHTRKVPLSEDVDLSQVAAQTPGMVGADLRNLVNEAALTAARGVDPQPRRGGDPAHRGRVLHARAREAAREPSSARPSGASAPGARDARRTRRVPRSRAGARRGSGQRTRKSERFPSGIGTIDTTAAFVELGANIGHGSGRYRSPCHRGRCCLTAEPRPEVDGSRRALRQGQPGPRAAARTNVLARSAAASA